MLQYLLNITAIWLISLLLFDLFLRRESYHGYNRFYLVFTFLLGLLLPLWQFNSSKTIVTLDEVMSGNPWLKWLAIIYLAGAAVAFSLLIIDIIKLVAFYRTGNRSKQDGWTIVETGREHPPFSYLDVLFISGRVQYSNDEWEMILTHEQRHSVLLHLIDMLMMQLSRIVFWFHPLVYIYHARLLLVQEYQADEASSKQPAAYGKFLVEQAVLKAAPAFSHSFNRSPIKNRILMLTRNAKQRTGLGNLKLLIIVPLTLVCVAFFSKNSYSIIPPGEIWKKQVTRIVDFPPQEDSMEHHLRNVGLDSTLLEIFVNAIYTDKITAYSNYDAQFTYKLKKEDLKGMLSVKPDTVILTDPVTGKEKTKVVKHDFDYSWIRKYKILEEWTYDQHTKKTTIEVLGIAPLQEIYVDGDFRGVRSMFWLHYKEALPILERYGLYHPNNTLEGHIWDDNFKAEEMLYHRGK
jgi:hypothetical protein